MAKAGKSSIRRRILKIFGLLLWGLLIGLVIVEIYFRFFFPLTSGTDTSWTPDRPYRHDVNVGLTYKPDWEGHLKTDEFEADFRSNSEGFRDDEAFITAENGEVIAVLGDSFTSGNHVDAEERFSEVLENLLLETPLDWQPVEQVQNYGIDGTGCVHYLQMYRHYVRPHHPGIVIIVVATINDFTDSTHLRGDPSVTPHYELNAAGEIVAVEPFTPPPDDLWTKIKRWLRDNIATYRFVNILKKRLAETGLGGLPKAYLMYEEPWNEDYAQAWDYCTWSLETLVTEIRADGAVPLMLMLTPRTVTADDSWATIERVYNENYPNEIQRDKLSRRMTEFADSLDVPFLDLFSPMEQALESGIEPYFEIDGHLNETGHQMVAELIYKELQAIEP